MFNTTGSLLQAVRAGQVRGLAGTTSRLTSGKTSKGHHGTQSLGCAPHSMTSSVQDNHNHSDKASCDFSDFTRQLTRDFRHNAGDVSPPSLKCLPSLREKLVALVDSCNA
jgi:hypothetical protein